MTRLVIVRAELSAYLVEGLDVPTYHLLRRQAREEEHRWFYHKSDEPVSRYHTLFNASYNPDELRG